MFFRALKTALLSTIVLWAFPAFSQQACVDIFTREASPSVVSFREIPMLERYKYERVSEDRRVHYLSSSTARARYEWHIQEGKLVTLTGGKAELLSTAVQKKDRNYDESIDVPFVEFVLSPERQLFGFTRDQHTRVFDETGLSVHHSTFLGGRPVNFAGNMEVHNGQITKLDNRSGHYRPNHEDFLIFLEWLSAQGVSLKMTDIRIEDMNTVLALPSTVKQFETYMPEIVFLAEQQNGYYRLEFLNDIKTRIAREFQTTGDSLLLKRTNFIWYTLEPAAQVFLADIAKAYGRTLPDPILSAP